MLKKYFSKSTVLGTGSIVPNPFRSLRYTDTLVPYVPNENDLHPNETADPHQNGVQIRNTEVGKVRYSYKTLGSCS
jgi:hypothetical protein